MSTTEPTDEQVEAAARSIAKESGHGNGLGLCWRQHIREARAALRAALSVAPPAPEVTVGTVEELDALPMETVIRTPQKYTLERLDDGWYRAGVPNPYPTGNKLMVPARVLFRPALEGGEMSTVLHVQGFTDERGVRGVHVAIHEGLRVIEVARGTIEACTESDHTELVSFHRTWPLDAYEQEWSVTEVDAVTRTSLDGGKTWSEMWHWFGEPSAPWPLATREENTNA